MADPTAADRLRGETIRQRRRRAGLTGEQLAAKIGVSQSTLSRAERDIAALSPEALRKLALVLPGEVDLDYVEPQRTSLGFEHDHVVREYSPWVVPGILQTHDYGRALISRLPGAQEAAVLESVYLRQARRVRMKERLEEDRPAAADRPRYLTTESALRNRTFLGDDGRPAWVAQMDALLRDLDWLRWRIVPADATPVALGPFRAYGDATVFEETLLGAFAHTDPAAVGFYIERFDALWDDALHGDGAVDLITRIRDEA